MHITSLSASPSERSRSAWLTQFALTRLEGRGTQHEQILVRQLPAAALLSADVQDPEIAAAVQAVAQADLVVVGTPIYKAAYSGLLKSLLDLLPQYALAGKTVLPLATGGSTAHVLAIDYALRPVLTSMGASHIVPGWFTLDKDVTAGEDGTAVIAPAAAQALEQVTDHFSAALGGRTTALASTG